MELARPLVSSVGELAKGDVLGASFPSVFGERLSSIQEDEGWLQAGAVGLPPRRAERCLFSAVRRNAGLDDARRKLPSAAWLAVCSSALRTPAIPLLFQPTPVSLAPYPAPGGLHRSCPVPGHALLAERGRASLLSPAPGVKQGGSASIQSISHPPSSPGNGDGPRRALFKMPVPGNQAGLIG